MCTQCVQIMPIITVPRPPNNKPAFLNAIGIANIPVPSELFNRCAKAPIVLRIKKKREREKNLHAINISLLKILFFHISIVSIHTFQQKIARRKKKFTKISLRVGMCHISVFEWIVISIFAIFAFFCQDRSVCTKKSIVQ